MGLTVTRQDGTQPSLTDGKLMLSAESSWVVEGDGPEDAPKLDELARSLRADLYQRVGHALLLRFGNAVGTFELPHLPTVEVESGKWGASDFNAMMSDISHEVASLPFTAGTGASLPYDRSISTDERVLYHAFVYLRHVLSPDAPRGDHLLPPLRAILADPHRRFERHARVVPLSRAHRVSPRTIQHIASGRGGLHRAPPGVAPALAQCLRGYLPENVEEDAVRATIDLPENRFVKAFIDQAIAVIGQVRAASSGRGASLETRVNADCDRMLKVLVPIRRVALWQDVSEMRRLPAESTVLHRRRGYREVFRHFLRMRMATRIPLSRNADDLLEIKDIAALYEIWCFFQVQKAVSASLGAPVDADAATTTAFQQYLACDLRVRWGNGTALYYNLRFSRSRPVRHSYSLPLRPDITLGRPDGRFHFLDAKFRLRKLIGGGNDVDDDEESAERRGDFKRADLYKMHTYRDALDALSVWVLYPGDAFEFFGAEDGDVPKHPDTLVGPVSGVGAVPLVPGEYGALLHATVEALLV